MLLSILLIYLLTSDPTEPILLPLPVLPTYHPVLPGNNTEQAGLILLPADQPGLPGTATTKQDVPGELAGPVPGGDAMISFRS